MHDVAEAQEAVRRVGRGPALAAGEADAREYLAELAEVGASAGPLDAADGSGSEVLRGASEAGENAGVVAPAGSVLKRLLSRPRSSVA